MKTKTFDAPVLYADHHVTEVRRILLELEGVTDVYASSAFQIIEVNYDETKINDLQIAIKLDEAGYLGEWTIPIELCLRLNKGMDKNPSSGTLPPTKQLNRRSASRRRSAIRVVRFGNARAWARSRWMRR
jgi:copper chaperone CopZ